MGLKCSRQYYPTPLLQIQVLEVNYSDGADVETMYIHILVVISAGSRVFSGTISHALTPAVVMISHDFLILT